MFKSAPTDIFIYGYYGAANLGDDLLLSAAVSGIIERWPSATFRVRNLGPIGLEEFGDRIVATDVERELLRSDRSRPLRVYAYLKRASAAMRGCRYFILGGGTLIQAKYSLSSLLLLAALLVLARARGLKVIGIGLGAAYLRSLPAKALAHFVTSLMIDVCVRDEVSRRELGYRGNVRLAADLVYGWWPRELDFARAETTPVVAVSLWSISPESESQILDALAEALEGCATDGWRLRFLVFQDCDDASGGLTDRVAIGKLSNKLAAQDIDFEVMRPGRRPDQIAAAFARVAVHCGARFHGSVIATLLGIPSVGLAIDPKVKSLLTHFGMPALETGEINGDRLLGAIRRARDTQVDPSAVERLRRRSALNFAWFDATTG